MQRSLKKEEFGEKERLDGVDFRLGGGAKVSGTVTDDKGKPMAGLGFRALLFFDDGFYFDVEGYFSGQTDSEGRFCIEGLPQSCHKGIFIEIHDEDGVFFRIPFPYNYIEIGTTDAQIVLKPMDKYISGRVIDAESGQPIPKFHILVGHPKADSLEELRGMIDVREGETEKVVELHNAWTRWTEIWRGGDYASADGRFTVDHLIEIPEAYLLVTADGYAVTEAGPVATTDKPDKPQITIRMQRGKMICGVITDSESGKPIPGACVTYFNLLVPFWLNGEILPCHIKTGRDMSPWGIETVYTNKNGEYELTTAQTHDNYLAVRAVAESKIFVGAEPRDENRPPEYAPLVIGPVEVTDDELFLPITGNKITKKQKSL
jgi:hypothetical protein